MMQGMFSWCQQNQFKLLVTIQVNLCQKLFFLQNMGRTCCVQKLFWMSKTISVHNMFSPCSELGIFMYWTCNSMNNLSSYFGLVYAKIRASDKDLPVCISLDHWRNKVNVLLNATFTIENHATFLVWLLQVCWGHLALNLD